MFPKVSCLSFFKMHNNINLLHVTGDDPIKYSLRVASILFGVFRKPGTEWNGMEWNIKYSMENKKTWNGKFKKPGMEYRKNILLISKMKQKTRRNRQSR